MKVKNLSGKIYRIKNSLKLKWTKCSQSLEKEILTLELFIFCWVVGNVLMIRIILITDANILSIIEQIWK